MEERKVVLETFFFFAVLGGIYYQTLQVRLSEAYFPHNNTTIVVM